jgi:ABC-2 type transport system permease protein
MSVSTATAGAGPELHAGGTTYVNVLRSEWVKLWSLRSTRWTIIATIVVTLAFTTLVSWAIQNSYNDPDFDRRGFDPTAASMFGVLFGQLGMAVLGALVITGEYTTCGIRTTFTAVPHRLKVVAAKFLVFGVVALVTGLVTCFSSFFIGQLFFATRDAEAHLSDPHVLRAVIGGGLYIAGSGMFGFALGALLRKTAAAVTAAAALLFVLPLLSNVIPGSLGDKITNYFTANAGGQIMNVLPTDGLAPWTGYAVFTVEWVILLVIGAYLIERIDP